MCACVCACVCVCVYVCMCGVGGGQKWSVVNKFINVHFKCTPKLKLNRNEQKENIIKGLGMFSAYSGVYMYGA